MVFQDLRRIKGILFDKLHLNFVEDLVLENPERIDIFRGEGVQQVDIYMAGQFADLLH